MWVFLTCKLQYRIFEKWCVLGKMGGVGLYRGNETPQSIRDLYATPQVGIPLVARCPPPAIISSQVGTYACYGA